MNILILNASPKGKSSVTLQTSLYLRALHPEHSFRIFHLCPRLRSLERDFTPLRRELVIFSYPVYTFIAPAQLHRAIELIKAGGVDLSGKCVYKDGFDTFLRQTIQTAGAMVYAFTLENHYAHSCFKYFDDRQFCNGHRTVTQGTPVGYIIRGDLKYEPNLRMIIEGRAEVGGNYLAGIATDEGDTRASLTALAANLTLAAERKFTRPANFYGTGGTKIFRDLIYTMQGFMKADHKFYKQHGVYDFPQKQVGTILKMKLVGSLMSIPQVRKK